MYIDCRTLNLNLAHSVTQSQLTVDTAHLKKVKDDIRLTLGSAKLSEM